MNETIQKVIDLELETLHNKSQNIEELNERFIKENSLQLVALVESAKVLYFLDPVGNQKRAITQVTNLDDILIGRTLKVPFLFLF